MNGAAIVGVSLGNEDWNTQTLASSQIMGYRGTGDDHLPRRMHAAAACTPHCYAHYRFKGPGRENPDLRGKLGNGMHINQTGDQ